jgi:hypothetical protein
MMTFAIGVAIGQFSVLGWIAFISWLDRTDAEEEDTHLQ